ncbi:hypothetical protein CsatA_009435 [Cannabis sativa]
MDAGSKLETLSISQRFLLMSIILMEAFGSRPQGEDAALCTTYGESLVCWFQGDLREEESI